MYLPLIVCYKPKSRVIHTQKDYARSIPSNLISRKGCLFAFSFTLSVKAIVTDSNGVEHEWYANNNYNAHDLYADFDADTEALTISGPGSRLYWPNGNYPYMEVKDRVKRIIFTTTNLTQISNSAFGGFEYLEEISIPEGVTTLGTRAFFECSSLEHIVLPDSLTTFNTHVFESCTFLKSVNIPHGVTELPSEVFRKCTSLEHLVLPSSVTKISDNAFYLANGPILNNYCEIHIKEISKEP